MSVIVYLCVSAPVRLHFTFAPLERYRHNSIWCDGTHSRIVAGVYPHLPLVHRSSCPSPADLRSGQINYNNRVRIIWTIECEAIYIAKANICRSIFFSVSCLQNSWGDGSCRCVRVRGGHGRWRKAKAKRDQMNEPNW